MTLEQFLQREEQLTNKTIPKRFRDWLMADQGAYHRAVLDRAISQGERKARAALFKAQEAYKADGAFKRQDKQRKAALKKFHDHFEQWLEGKEGQIYARQIENLEKRSFPDLQARSDALTLAREEAEAAFAHAHPHLMPEGYKMRAKTRVRPSRYGFFADAEEVTFAVIEPGIKQLGFMNATIMRDWVKVVGSALAQNTRPLKTHFKPNMRTHGSLVLSVRNGFQLEIQHQKSVLLHRVNGYFGFRAIDDIQISKVPFHDIITTGARTSQRVIASRVQPAERPTKRIENLLQSVKDEDFKALFYEMGKVIKARNGES